jgi:hypothetical protein
LGSLAYWITVTVCPATVSVPVRYASGELAATSYRTVPLPVPLAPDVIVSQDALLVAVQPQDEPVVTVTLSELAVPGGVTTMGETVKAHDVAACCVTVTVRPATVSVPVRVDAFGFSAIENATVPLPVPLDPDVIVSHAALLVATQVQFWLVVTATLLVPAVAAGVSDVGDTVKEHEFELPACVTVTVCPATVNVPVRDEVVAFAAIEKLTVPLPVPLAPAVTVSHAVLLIAAQVQPAVVVTAVLLEPALDAVLSDVGDTPKVHGAGAAAWVTVTVWPATVSVPVRGEVAGFAAIEKFTAPFPLPLAPEVTVSHAALLVAVQVQPAAVVTAVLLEPAVDAGLSEVGDTL